MEENTPGTDLTLEELKDKFENYRKNKSYQREPIPKELWEAAVELARKHSIATVCRELHLRYQSLKEHIGTQIPKNKFKEKLPSFVELTQPLLSEITVDMENSRGCKMRIGLKESFDISLIIKSFCKL